MSTGPFERDDVATTAERLRARLQIEAARITPADRGTELFAAAARRQYPGLVDVAEFEASRQPVQCGTRSETRPDPQSETEFDIPGVEMSEHRSSPVSDHGSDPRPGRPASRRNRVWQPLLAAAAVAVIAVGVVLVVNRPAQQPAGPGPSTASQGLGSSPSAPATTPATSQSPSAPATTSPSTTPPTTAAAPTDDGAPIWIALPAEGLTVPAGTSFTVTGKATVFEATVSWELRQGTTVVKKGFTNASIGAPDRGDWSVTIASVPGGNYTFHAFENSAKDGSVLHEVSRPITVG